MSLFNESKSTSAMKRLGDFIKETRTNEMTHTHVLLGAPFGKINISNGRMKEFWDIYINCVDFINPIYLAEKPLTELPVLVDVDLKTRLKDQSKNNDKTIDRIYTYNQVVRVIAAYQDTLKNQVLIDIKPEALTCILLEKKPYIIELNGIKYVKNGFHLHFPKLFIDKNIQEAYIIPIVKSKIKGLFDNLYTRDDGTGLNKLQVKSDKTAHYEFIDNASISVHWLMYGSKKPNNLPYIATKCYADNVECVDFETALRDYNLPLLSGEKEKTTCFGRVVELLPRILSTRLHGRTDYYYKAKPSVLTPVFETFANVKLNRPSYAQKSVDDIMKEVNLLMPLINDRRADDRSDWLAIGFCLWNISHGDEDGLSTWLEFSDRSEKFNEAECICLWNGMRENSYTLATLKYFAKIDDPVLYEQICKTFGDLLINLAVEGGHNDMAKILKNEYGQEFVYSIINCSWYRFTNHIWKKQKSKCFDLSERISDNNGAIITHFTRHIDESKSELKRLNVPVKKPTRKKVNQDETNQDTYLISRLEDKIKTLTKLIKSCKVSNFKQCVMKECEEVFRNDFFADKLNTNPYLVAFKNGVYDFKNDCFRAGKPEDYLSISLPIEYKDYGSIDNPEVLEIASFFRQVLPDDQVRLYFLDQVCQLFVGGNCDKVILIWTGSGDNGKSVTQRLFEKMLGPLSVKIGTSLITGSKTKMGQAAPELARTGNGVRWVVMDEPNQDEQITTGLLKSITGNDSYWARDLYQGGSETKEIVPMYLCHMLCNENLPTVKFGDNAFWERIRVIPFETKFLSEEQCPDTYEERMLKKIFPKDGHFDAKMDSLLQPLAWFLISHWRGLNKTERIIPEKVKMATGGYKEENSDNPFQDFLSDYVEKHVDGVLSADELYSRYQPWFIRNNPRQKISNKKTSLTAFSKLLGTAASAKQIKGYRWIHKDDDMHVRMVPI